MAESTPVTPLEKDFPFEIISHLIPITPFREYPHAIIDEQKGIRLSVKQYIPLKAETPSSNTQDPITIIVSGGVGFIKEIYEPFFAELLSRTNKSNVTIRSIWIADMFNMGESAIANLENLGCDPTWIDHSRDLWSMINHFHTQMPKPIIGLGHSVGCNQLLCLSSWHPTLFHSFAFVEPGIDPNYGREMGIQWVYQMLQRKESWPTREEAEIRGVKAQGAGAWGEKVRSRLKVYGVVQTGTNSEAGSWALTTPKNQIASLVFRHNPGNVGLEPGGLDEVTLAQREIVPDSNPADRYEGPFYRPEMRLGWDLLPGMRPWVLYVNGGKSPLFGNPVVREQRARITGTGVGGNGGMRLGAVRQVVIEDGEHTMPFDRNLNNLADHVGNWLVTESQRWTDGPKRRRVEWQAKSLKEKQSVSKEFVDAVSSIMGQKRAEKL
ncbi:uncharacterized protein N7484_001584 [Penicillium longicatenatum]|uniref:uncharacterized protein n=1 Tax=Penicillium longicatenatum TaxID=1561947 RepID=UPI002546996F|nr:uncharacterized protein N7484_001584 [Penicillium longicatenatum]KAJ5657935.1 hypothetical protein N7484_001584 [Penicillium longicatenatum]